jgi:hypothetical protein
LHARRFWGSRARLYDSAPLRGLRNQYQRQRNGDDPFSGASPAFHRPRPDPSSQSAGASLPAPFVACHNSCIGLAFGDRSLCKPCQSKLGRTDPNLSEAIVRFCAEKLRPVLKELPRADEPNLPGYRTRILDGNVLTGTDHRLGALRQWLNASLPGKSLVVLEPDLGLISDLVLCEDAYTQERALMEYILERVQAEDLPVFDRNFTTTGFAFGIAELPRTHSPREQCGIQLPRAAVPRTGQPLLRPDPGFDSSLGRHLGRHGRL